MDKWIEVVTDPLGLVGFALFLVFTAAARYGMRRGQGWLPVAAVSMAVIALVGGLVLSWNTQDRRAAAQSAQQGIGGTPAASEVRQRTEGVQSPAIQGVSGNVSITIGGKEGK
jgi:tetrahydromethanopterin S-methyltransferase subunit D